jgi:2-polyprenyl-6-methoxyphenol hydroxylase-like FAD-dependent oxidoreductase
MHWSAYFRIHHRHVAQLRSGRFFIASDAAHIHSPFGGQGMNTGLQGVWNLVWKLDLLLRGPGNEQLLGSDSEERIPVIKSVIQTTDLLTKFMGTPSNKKAATRIAASNLQKQIFIVSDHRVRHGHRHAVLHHVRCARGDACRRLRRAFLRVRRDHHLGLQFRHSHAPDRD